MGNRNCGQKYNPVKSAETTPSQKDQKAAAEENSENNNPVNGNANNADTQPCLEGRKRITRIRRFSNAVRNILRITDDPSVKEVASGQILSPYEQRLLKQTWAALEDDKDLFGQMIYLKVFETEPALKILFLWDDIPTELLCQNPAFQKHALNIVKIVESCVKRVDCLHAKVAVPLQRLGKKHTRFQSFGFTPYHWELFQVSMITALTCEFSEDKRKDDIVNAWRKLTTFVVDEMRQGYNDCLAKLPAKSQNIGTKHHSTAGNATSQSATPNNNQVQTKRRQTLVTRRRSNEAIHMHDGANLTDYLKIAYPQYSQKRLSSPG